MEKLEQLIWQCALENSLKYDGKADVHAVLGCVFAREKNSDRAVVINLARKIIDDVNSLSLPEQVERLNKIGRLKKTQKKKKEITLPNVKGRVVVRFAPNPNGYMTFGHARVGLWNWYFVRKYKGIYILRFDDTDPRTKAPLKEAYDAIKNDLEWLGVRPRKVVIQSKRLNIYYKYAEKLIMQGNAYVDTLPAEKMREMLMNQEISDEREESPVVVMRKWKKMLTKYKDGEAVLRIKTNINHPNPALRDWPAFRIITRPKHPLTKSRVWPLLNFASAIDDYEFGVTHIIRGIDLEVSDDKQKFIYDYFGWTYPHTLYHGRFLISGIRSTSEALELIKEGKLTGWDDPRLGTIAALRKRGFLSKALVNFVMELGLGRADINVNIDSLAAHNRNVVDKIAKRFFVVFNPRKIKINNAPKMKIKILLHPEFPKIGYREFETNNEFYVDETFESGKYYRFIDLFNFRNLEYMSTELDGSVNVKFIHWLPVSKDLINVEVVMPDNTVKIGFGEKGIRYLNIGDVIQLVRIGFCRLDRKYGKKCVFYFAHR